MRHSFPAGLAALLALSLLSCDGDSDAPPCDPPAVPAPVGPAPGELACGPSAGVEWSGVAFATGYEAQLFGEAGCSQSLLDSVSTSAFTTAGVFLGLQDGGTYWWHVRAVNDDCDPTAYSAWSDCRPFTVTTEAVPTPEAPVLLHPCSETTVNAAGFFWTGVADADRYLGLVCKTACDPAYWSGTFAVDAPGTSAALELAGAGSYVWHVWAENQTCWPYKRSGYQNCFFDVE